MVDRLGYFLAGLALIALLPGTFFYHVLSAFRAIPMFLGGWWGVAILVFGALLAPLSLISVLRQGVRPVHWAFAILSLIVLGYAVFHRYFGQSWQRTDEALVSSATLIAGWTCFFGIGHFLAREVGRSLRWTILGSWGVIALAVIVLADPATRSFDLQTQFGDPELADYKFLGACFALLSVFAAGVTQSGGAKGIIFAISGIALFIMTARADMVAMLGLGFLGVPYGFAWYRRWVPTAIVVTVLMLGVALLLLPKVSGPAPAVTRGEVARGELFNMAESQSANARAGMLERGVTDIVSSPVFGVYAGQVADGSAWGTYMHNILGAWRQFGVFAFMLYAALVYGAMVAAFCSWRTEKTLETERALLITIYVVGMCTIVNGVFWIAPAIAWGMAAYAKVPALNWPRSVNAG